MSRSTSNRNGRWMRTSRNASTALTMRHCCRKLDANPAVTRQIKAWLKAGVVDKGELFPTAAGTPQGGTISPLLAKERVKIKL